MFDTGLMTAFPRLIVSLKCRKYLTCSKRFIYIVMYVSDVEHCIMLKKIKPIFPKKWFPLMMPVVLISSAAVVLPIGD